MVTDPDATPVTTPVEEFTVATAVLLLVQTPLAVLFARVMVEFTQTCVAPVIAATVGSGLTVTDFVTVTGQLFVVTVYEMVTTPAETPVTRPVDEVMVAKASSLLDQTPPAVLQYKGIVAPTQTAFPPPDVKVPELVKVCVV
jgi:hypothetical protein